MNIFYLSDQVVECAQWHVDDHVIKMMTEYAQLLSTTHRVCDGTLVSIDRSHIGKRAKKLLILDGETILPDDINNPTEDGYTLVGKKCCINTHQNHPSAVWARMNDKNYQWLYSLLEALRNEWRNRYGHSKMHKYEQLYSEFLSKPPKNIPKAEAKSPMLLAMDPKYQISSDPIECYRHFYVTGKAHLAKWKNRNAPWWYSLPNQEVPGT